METADEFLIAERAFSDEESKLSIGLANIHAEVPGIEANKGKILRAVTIFKERGVNFAIFPELSLSGYFWDQRNDCHPLHAGGTDRHWNGRRGRGQRATARVPLYPPALKPGGNGSPWHGEIAWAQGRPLPSRPNLAASAAG
jgi:hypothetical protein